MLSIRESFLGVPEAEIMMVGTFHFLDPGLDRYQPRTEVDMLSAVKQREISEVVELLSLYKPTKVAIERTLSQQSSTDEEYRKYLNGELELTADEVHQIGFRIAERIKLDRVNCVNDWGQTFDPALDIESSAVRFDQRHLLSEWWPRFEALFEYEERNRAKCTLRESLLRLNVEENVTAWHGIYLVDEFKVGRDDHYQGVDHVTSWYNRNLRIFANLQRITNSAEEKILLVIGAGHLPILRHAILSSPEYRLVELEEYL